MSERSLLESGLGAIFMNDDTHSSLISDYLALSFLSGSPHFIPLMYSHPDLHLRLA